jgi:hypothetical protein
MELTNESFDKEDIEIFLEYKLLQAIEKVL